MRDYETVVVFRADLPQPALEAEIQNVRKLIEGGGGQTIDVQDWGRKDLAYAAKKQTAGRYIVYRYKAADHGVVGHANGTLRITESVLKFQSHRLIEARRKFQGNPRLLKRTAPEQKFGTNLAEDEEI